MAALAASSWTVTVITDRITAKERRIHASMILPTTGTYTTNGVPMPLFSTFGFKRSIEHAIISTEGANTGLEYKYDETNNSIRIYTTSNGNELATTANGDGSSSATTLFVTAIGW